MRIDTRIIPTDHNGEPFTAAAIDAATLWARVKQLNERGTTDSGELIKTIESEIDASFGQKIEDLLKPMDLGDCLTKVVEWSKEYNGEAAGPKKDRARLVRLLVAEGEVELTDAQVKILKSDIEGPRVGAQMMLALDELLVQAEARAIEEDKRKREETAKGAALTAVQEATG